MKIAFLTPEYPHPKTGSSGGIGTSIKNLAKGLLAAGFSVRVLVYGQTEESVFDDGGVIVQQIKNIKLKGISWYLTRKKLERIINSLHKNNKIDIVEAPDWTGITSFISPQNCPIVNRLNGSDTYFCHLDSRPVKWKNKFHEKRALQKADALLSASQFTANLTNEVFGLQKEFTIIPNSIDVSLFNYNFDNNISIPSSPLLRRGGVGEDTILYFGSLIRKKGLLELPLVFNILIQTNPNAKLILVGKDVPDIITGSASTWKMMQDLFSEEALKSVTYLGSVPNAEIQEQIAQAAVCVFPSFAEALPVSWLEAMAMQKAVVASNVGWASEIIQDGVEGFLVHPTNHDEYANKISALLNNTELQRNFGIAARKKITDKFDIDRISKMNIEFYKRVINNKK
jgi:glycosyltransferase involved in cell wall biosynthesis